MLEITTSMELYKFEHFNSTEYSRKFIRSPISTLDKYAVDYTSTLPLAVQRPDSSTACYSSALDSSWTNLKFYTHLMNFFECPMGMHILYLYFYFM